MFACITGKTPVGLVVAHFTGENIEVIQPLKVTNTHVIISVPDLSFFGLLKKMVFYDSPIRAQILIFYKDISGWQSRKQLHMHLLPSNVPVEEVIRLFRFHMLANSEPLCFILMGFFYCPLKCLPIEGRGKAKGLYLLQDQLHLSTHHW